MKTLLILFSVALLTGCPSKVILPDAELKHDTICGKDPCRPGNGIAGTLLKFTKDPISPDVQQASTSKQVALQLVGKTVKRNDFSGKDPITCHATDSTPFGNNEVTLKSGSWKKVKFERKEKLTIDVNAAASADIDAIKSIAPGVDLTQMEAKIKAAYSSISGAELVVNAYYSEYGLNTSTIDNITRGVKFVACKEFMKQHNRALITDIGLLFFDVTKNGESIDNIGAEIKTDLENLGIQYNIAASIRHEVTENMNSIVDAGYQIVAWRIYHIEDITL